jgi:hypothetical protein
MESKEINSSSLVAHPGADVVTGDLHAVHSKRRM